MRAMRLSWAVTLGVLGLVRVAVLGAQAPQTPSRWAQPAAEVAGQITDILGQGQAQVTIRNLSTMDTSEIPIIRRLLEQDLKAHGVPPSGAESANAIRVTLSENTHERLWVAEVAEGNATHVAIVHVDLSVKQVAVTDARMVLRREKVPGLFNRIGGVVQDNPILAAVEINGHFVVMYADRISIFSSGTGGWTEGNTFLIYTRVARDARGGLAVRGDGGGFSAHYAG